ncbi:hypothetical protein A2954_06590 [Candidatus Roizmanbacteria bacterium RIFCSPLOWO2_01_FULL_37_12]|uniref:Uncharacterized protein n=1 Tax=Candidatus Roizmanbacteria bacterium RIFCSPLOWO2_01_FULL_37_12 TaxID=1802056 RepID=A0A1F7I8I8_9BACT|nr:MAG: hypothetical protein A2768_00140 [Candidatus Roizmanbacteria bacterium RIFCSPHIGHO2_01_FULL_37_16]OGK39676.1 MAG: hypothetical protein A2954_06590 [Candidatus Roizmanbacteria bacterium RIFCSPLOWO2_01_FULL_37_12]
MVNQANSGKYNLDLLRGWRRDQLRLLKEFTLRPLISQTLISTASGATIGSHELGGKLTALTRAELIIKAGKDDNGSWIWQLNEEKVEKETLKEFLDKIKI